jgi:hypothetical protein
MAQPQAQDNDHTGNDGVNPGVLLRLKNVPPAAKGMSKGMNA